MRRAFAPGKATSVKPGLARQSLWLSVLLVLLLSLAENATGQNPFSESDNLLDNPGCEDKNEGGGDADGNVPLGWIQSSHSSPKANTLNCDNFSATRAGTDYGPHNGSFYFVADDLERSNEGDYAVTIRQRKSIPPGATKIRASGWFYRQVTTNEANGRLRLAILNASSDVVADELLPQTEWLQDIGISYVKKSITLDVPSGGTQAQLVIIHSNNHQGDSAWGADLWDDMELVALTPVINGSTVMIATTATNETTATTAATPTTTTMGTTATMAPTAGMLSESSSTPVPPTGTSAVASTAPASSSITTASSTTMASSAAISTSSLVSAPTTTPTTSVAPTSSVSVDVAVDVATSPAFSLWAIILIVIVSCCLLILSALLVVRRVALKRPEDSRDNSVATMSDNSYDSDGIVYDSDYGAPETDDPSSSMEIVYASLNDFATSFEMQ